MQSNSIEDERSETSQADGYSSDKDIDGEPEHNVYHLEEPGELEGTIQSPFQ